MNWMRRHFSSCAWIIEVWYSPIQCFMMFHVTYQIVWQAWIQDSILSNGHIYIRICISKVKIILWEWHGKGFFCRGYGEIHQAWSSELDDAGRRRMMAWHNKGKASGPHGQPQPCSHGMIWKISHAFGSLPRGQCWNGRHGDPGWSWISTLRLGWDDETDDHSPRQSWMLNDHWIAFLDHWQKEVNNRAAAFGCLKRENASRSKSSDCQKPGHYIISIMPGYVEIIPSQVELYSRLSGPVRN